MNIKLSYMYRDAANYKEHGEVILHNPTGMSVKEAAARINPTLEGGSDFIAEQVGLPSVANYVHADVLDDDHCFHEILDLEATDEEPTTNLSISEVIASFEAAGASGWDVFDPFERYGVG